MLDKLEKDVLHVEKDHAGAETTIRSLCFIGILFFVAFYTSIQYTVQKDAQLNSTAQRIREIVLSRFSVYIRVCGEKNYETCALFSALHPD